MTSAWPPFYMYFRRNRRMTLWLAGLVAVVAAAVLTITVVRAAFATVRPVDDCSQFGHPGDSGLTLFDALQVAGTGDTIEFKCAGTITVPSTISVNFTLTLDGAGNAVTLDGANSVQLFQINGPASLTIKGLTIAHGFSTVGGGAFFVNGGSLSLSNSTVTANTASGTSANGGGMYLTTGSTLTITSSTVSNNSANVSGGAIYIAGGSQGEHVTIGGSTFSGNSTSGSGGGIGSNAQGFIDMVSIDSSTFNGNTASQAGGGVFIFNGGELSVTNSTFSNNIAPGSAGGLWNDLVTTISGSTFTNNQAVNGQGGAVRAVQGLTISTSTFSGNQAQTGGAVYTGFADGPAALSITTSTFNGNTASNSGAGIYMDTTTNSAGTFSLSNSTLTGNTANGEGGALYTVDGTDRGSIINTTFTSNSASGGGGGLFLNAPVVTVSNSIIASNPSGLDCLGPAPLDGGYNLTDASPNTCAFTPSNHDVLTGSPGLGSLGNNGGPTQTIPLQVGSPAIDAANATVCAAAPINNLDQRGVTRPQGAGCDIGAYEFVPLTSTTTLTSSANPAVSGQTITFTAAVSGGSGTPTGTAQFFADGSKSPFATVTLDGSGHAATTLSNLAVGTHSLSATYGGDRTYASSASNTVSQVVNQASTQTALVADINPSVLGQTVTFTITVTAVSPGSGTPTGTVKLYADTTFLGTPALNGSGVATLSTSTLPVSAGANINAGYSGDTNFAFSSGSLTQFINKANTTTTLNGTPNPSAYGQLVTLTATIAVNSPGSGTPSGTVDFKEGTTLLGSGTVSAGAASIGVSALAPGSHSITATYNGDSSFNRSTSSPVSQVVNQASTTTAVGADHNPSVFGQSVTFTATVAPVAPGAGTPTGTVTFKDGTTSLGTGTLSGGTASLSTSALAVGSHSITATYGGDTNFAGSASSTSTQTVNQAATATMLTSNINPSVYGQTVTLTATTSVISPGSGTPTGTVTFMDGATTFATATLSGNTAVMTTAALGTGSHNLTASYGGDTNFAGSASSILTQVVNQASTTTSVGADHNPSLVGQSVTFTATVAAVAPGAGTPTGSVTFMDGATTLGSGTLSGGQATFATASLSPGSHTITAVYGGDTNFTASTSSALTQVVNQAGSTTTLSADHNPSVYGQTVNFSATVSPVAPATGTPTGTVTFTDGATTLGTSTLSGGAAILSTSALAVGSHGIIATYNGDTTFASSVSATYTQTVNQASTGVVLSADHNPSVFGQSVTFTATVLPTGLGSGTPTGTVTFKDGTTTLGTGTLSGGQTTFATAALNVGSHSITATYGGDTNFTGSASPPSTQTVNQASTTTSVGADHNPSVFGQSVTLTATVGVTSPGAGTPTGSVTFKDGATTLGTGTLSGGQATFATASLAVGGHSITATYAGDANFSPSASSTLTQTVNQASTTTALATSLTPSVFGQSVTLTATVGASSPGAGTPTGTVTFKDGATTIATATLSGGTAVVTDAAFSVGSHSLTATYAGDANFAGSASAVTTQVVNLASTTTTVGADHNPSVFGQSVTFTATVAAVAPGSGTPTGSVTFSEGITTLGSGALSGGSAAFSTASLSAGVHSITASYSGDGNFTSSTSSVFTQAVNQAATTTSLASFFTPSVYGENVDFTATIAAVAPGSGSPSGSVTFSENTTTLGTGTLSGGQASFSTATLAVGTHTITATYGGDTNFTGSAASIQQTVVVSSSTTTLTSDVNNAMFSSNVNFTATVSPVAPGGGTPTGSVVFKDGSTTLATVPLSGGTAVFGTSSLSGGSHTITATYGGDANFTGSNGQMTETVVAANVTVSLAFSLNPVIFNQTETFTSVVTAVSPASGVPFGTVDFLEGNSDTLLGSTPLSNGVATFAMSTLALGPHSIRASYHGNQDWEPNSSAFMTLNVNPGTRGATAWYFAEGYTGGNATEYLTLANPDGHPNATAHVQVEYLMDNGATLTKNYTVAPASRFTIIVNNEVGHGKNVSMVVTSDLPIVAERPYYVTYIGSFGSLPSGTNAMGATSLAEQFDFAYIDTTANHDTWLTILNPESTLMHVSVEYFPAAGGAPTTIMHTVPGNSRGTVYVNGEMGLPRGVYSALVTLDQPGLVERPLYQLHDTYTGKPGATDVVGVAQPLTSWYFAEGFTSPTVNERYILANPTTSTGNVNATVTYLLSDGSTITDQRVLIPGQQVIVNANVDLGNGQVSNSALVTSDHPILAERFMSFGYFGSAGAGSANASINGASEVLGAPLPTTVALFAEGYTGGQVAEYLTIENPSQTAQAHVTVTFLPANGTMPLVKNYTILPHSRFTLYTNSVLPGQFFALAVDADIPVVAERPMYFIYNGFAPGGTDVLGYQPVGS